MYFATASLSIKSPTVSLNAVSYTHLDVYKRQINASLYRNKNIKNPSVVALVGPSGSGKTALSDSPVSYTHLDVYKRQQQLYQAQKAVR